MSLRYGYSIIIASYNEGVFLKKTIDSLFKNAHYPKFEIIIVDDGSQDDFSFLRKAAYVKKPIRLVRTEYIGIDAARNLGVKQAVYDILIFVDAHMLFSKGWLKSVNQLFIKHPSLSFLGLSCENIFDGKIKKKNDHFHVYTPLNITLEQNMFLNIKKNDQQLIKVPVINGANLIIKREVFDSVGGFWEVDANWQDNFFSIITYYLGIDAYIAPHIPIYHHLIQSNSHVPTDKKLSLDKSLLACFLLYPKHIFEDCIASFKEKYPTFLLSKTYKNFLYKSKYFIRLKKAIEKYQKRTYSQFVKEHSQYLPAFQLHDYLKGERLMFINNKKAKDYLEKAYKIEYLGNESKKKLFKKNVKNMIGLIS